MCVLQVLLFYLRIQVVLYAVFVLMNREREKCRAPAKRMLKVRTLVVLYLGDFIVVFLFISKGYYSGLNN